MRDDGVISNIEKQEWLKPTEEGLQKVVHQAFGFRGPESDLGEGKPIRAEHNGTPILLVRRGSQIYALAETCSHLGGPLSEGKLEGDVIQCSWHGSRFSIRDGHVVDGPAVHPQPCLEARIQNGQVEVRKSNCPVAAAHPAQARMKPQPNSLQ